MVEKLLRPLAIPLEIPFGNQVVNDHRYDVKGEDHLRYINYAAHSPFGNKQVGELCSPGHTDLGTVTLPFEDPQLPFRFLTPKENGSGSGLGREHHDQQAVWAYLFSAASLSEGKPQRHRSVLKFLQGPIINVVLDPSQTSALLNRFGLTKTMLPGWVSTSTCEQWVKAWQAQ